MTKFENWIEAYLNGTLSEDQKQLFEQELQLNNELNNHLEDHKKLFKQLELLRIKTKVKKAISDKKSNFPAFAVIKIAAACVCGIILIYFLIDPDFNTFETSKVNELALDSINQSAQVRETVVYEDEIDSPQEKKYNNAEVKSDISNLFITASTYLILYDIGDLRGSISDSKDKLSNTDSIYSALQLKNYTQALTLLKSINPTEGVTQMLMAECQFKLKKFKESSLLYSKLLSDIQFKYDAEWNLVLCQLMLNDTNMFKMNLSKIIKDPSHPYHERAVILRKDLTKKNLVN